MIIDILLEIKLVLGPMVVLKSNVTKYVIKDVNKDVSKDANEDVTNDVNEIINKEVGVDVTDYVNKDVNKVVNEDIIHKVLAVRISPPKRKKVSEEEI